MLRRLQSFLQLTEVFYFLAVRKLLPMSIVSLSSLQAVLGTGNGFDFFPCSSFLWKFINSPHLTSVNSIFPSRLCFQYLCSFSPLLIFNGSWVQIWTQEYHFTQHSYSMSWRQLKDAFLYLGYWFMYVSQYLVYLSLPNNMILLTHCLLSH